MAIPFPRAIQTAIESPLPVLSLPTPEPPGVVQSILHQFTQIGRRLQKPFFSNSTEAYHYFATNEVYTELKPALFAIVLSMTIFWILINYFDPYCSFLRLDNFPVPTVHQYNPGELSLNYPHIYSHTNYKTALVDSLDVLKDINSIQNSDSSQISDSKHIDEYKDDSGKQRQVEPTSSSRQQLQKLQQTQQQTSKNNKSSKSKPQAIPDSPILPDLPRPTVTPQDPLTIPSIHTNTTSTTSPATTTPTPPNSPTQQRLEIMHEQESYLINEQHELQDELRIPGIPEQPEPLNQQTYPLFHIFDIIGAKLGIIIDHFCGVYATDIKQTFVSVMIMALFTFITCAVVALGVIVYHHLLAALQFTVLFVLTYYAGNMVGYLTDTRLIETA